MRFWTCWDALDLGYRHEKRMFDLGYWLARYCILKIEYIIVSYIIILRYGSIGGPKNNIAFTFAFDLKVGSYSCYIIFRRIYFILVWRIFFYMVLYRFITGSRSKL